MRNFKIFFFVVGLMSISGCEDEKVQRRKVMSDQFPTEYFKKHPEDANIVVKYEFCTKGREETLDKCIFLVSKNDMEILILNKYVAERDEYLRKRQEEEAPKK